uniref:zinc finger protein 239-like n=1 Tax=Pristiophorus japonicus TaxID=55135 RepID=UPI00398E7DA7
MAGEVDSLNHGCEDGSEPDIVHRPAGILQERNTLNNSKEINHSQDGQSKGIHAEYSLHSHERVHTGEPSLKCPERGKEFAQLFPLVMHQRTFAGKKTIQCETCGKDFSNLSSLHSHKKTHAAEKAFKCPDCEKGFCQSSSLVVHQHTHTGERPFQCPACEKSFSDPSNLARHKRSHTGKKPFQCPDCASEFSQLSDLVRHQRMHTGRSHFGMRFVRRISVLPPVSAAIIVCTLARGPSSALTAGGGSTSCSAWCCISTRTWERGRSSAQRARGVLTTHPTSPGTIAATRGRHRTSAQIVAEHSASCPIC